jgi:hypothetical protein
MAYTTVPGGTAARGAARPAAGARSPAFAKRGPGSVSALDVEALGLQLEARQGVAGDVVHPRPEGEHGVEALGDGVHDVGIGALAQLDLDVHLVHLAHLVHGDAELVDLGELAQDVLDAGREDVHAAHRHHVVGAADDAALEPERGAAAVAALRGGAHDVAGLVADDGEAPAAEVGDDQLAALAFRHRPAAGRVEDLGDVLALDEMGAAGLHAALEGMRADLGGAGVVEALGVPRSSMRALVDGTLAPGSPACTVAFIGMVDRSKPVSRATSARRRA